MHANEVNEVMHCDILLLSEHPAIAGVQCPVQLVGVGSASSTYMESAADQLAFRVPCVVWKAGQ